VWLSGYLIPELFTRVSKRFYCVVVIDTIEIVATDGLGVFIRSDIAGFPLGAEPVPLIRDEIATGSLKDHVLTGSQASLASG